MSANGGARYRHAPPMKDQAQDTNGDAEPMPGLKSLDHYKKALPGWRYSLRQKALPLVRWETPYLALLQDTLRTPALDSYFAITANLGTHTFFMIGLPVLFWCGYGGVGKGLVHILALGVYWSGFLKDFFSLPRPLSPPLHRITMSGSVSLEYGFPSTHSANALSVAVYGLMMLYDPDNSLNSSVKLGLEILCYTYAVSIVFGRLYCGMHGFLDVIVGSALGAGIGWLEFYYGPPLDEYMHSSSWVAPAIAALIVVILIRVHPEPADDCPCFDDSVAFAGTIIGIEVGTWSYGKIANDPWETYAYGDNTINVSPLGWPTNIARLVIGVIALFLWRETMKPFLLKVLPRIFRLIEQLGLSLPRRFFTPATQYETVPPGSSFDTMFPKASDFPRMVESIRHPTTRGRSISIGPQSAADAYETLAYRERKRRESVGSNSSLRSKESHNDLSQKYKEDGEKEARTSGAQTSPVRTYEKMMGEGEVAIVGSHEEEDEVIFTKQEHELEQKEVFSHISKPRVRYDVEVVTKLVVYAGIGWLAVAGVPLLFESIGLGTNDLGAKISSQP